MNLFKLLLCSLLFFLPESNHAIEKNAKPFVVPELRQWQGGEGQMLLTNASRVVIPRGNDSLRQVAQMLVDDVNIMWKHKPEIVEGKSQMGDVVFAVKKDKTLGAEGYEMNITDRVTITAPTCQGAYWATRTLLQMSEQALALPRGKIRDWPAYRLRGFMMDCGRKYIPMSYLHKLVKVMAYYKMNTLQVHLNDNGFKVFFDDDWDKTYAAFRLESETYPGLAARDGHYTKREFIDFQKEAEKRFVEIIPEIDVPAHTLAFAHYRPSLGSKDYGMDHFDLFNPDVYTFVDGLFKEYLEGDEPVFRGPRVHIGTDEYSNKDQKVVEKFRYFTDRYIRYVESFGKQAVFWGSLTHAKGETPVKAENVWIGAWYNGYADPIEMKKLGYKMISIPDDYLYIVPAAGYYHDYLQTDSLYLKWEPCNVNGLVFEKGDPAILGGMFAVWNDHCGNGITVKDIHHRLMPAIHTLSTKCWTAEDTSLPFADFDKRRLSLSEAPGVNELAILSRKPAVVMEQGRLRPNTRYGLEEIGYNYRISFEVNAKPEQFGTELLRSEHAVFYLSDPISGLIGFAREGYLYTFSHALPQSGICRIAIEGDNQATRLYLNGKLVEELNTRRFWYDKEGKKSMAQVRTLVFPLRHTGRFASEITHFKVEQQ